MLNNQTVSLKSLEQLKQTLLKDCIMNDYEQMALKVHQNETIMALYDQYIAKQKELVKFDHYHKSNAKAQVEVEMKELEEQLFAKPLFNEYLNTQIELNELFQSMKHLIEQKVNQHLSEN